MLETSRNSIILETGWILNPISVEQVREKLNCAFRAIENAPGCHSVLDTDWKSFVNKRSFTCEGIAIGESQLHSISQKPGDIDILDEGCGSSRTLFQVIERIEEDRVEEGKVTGCGITASPDFLFKGVPLELKAKVLNSSEPRTQNRQKLLLEGVKDDETKGLFRDSPKGNRMTFHRVDAHFIDDSFPGQRFDLIYSSAAYSHFVAPWVAFEKACNALKVGGVCMIDAIPSSNIVNDEGVAVPLQEFQDSLQRRNPNFEVYFGVSSSPFSLPVIVKRHGSGNIDTGLCVATVTDPRLGIQDYRCANVLDENGKTGYVPLSAIKAK